MATNGQKNGEANTGVGTESINTEIITLTRFLTEEQTKHKEATGDFTLLCHALQFAFKSIAYYIRRATLINVRTQTKTPIVKSNLSPSLLALLAPQTQPAMTRRSLMSLATTSSCPPCEAAHESVC